jgi:hypothetical protein
MEEVLRSMRGALESEDGGAAFSDIVIIFGIAIK